VDAAQFDAVSVDEGEPLAGELAAAGPVAGGGCDPTEHAERHHRADVLSKRLAKFEDFLGLGGGYGPVAEAEIEFRTEDQWVRERSRGAGFSGVGDEAIEQAGGFVGAAEPGAGLGGVGDYLAAFVERVDHLKLGKTLVEQRERVAPASAHANAQARIERANGSAADASSQASRATLTAASTFAAGTHSSAASVRIAPERAGSMSRMARAAVRSSW
jgi:hypothetical protein